MALPPEPLDELLPEASAGVKATVEAILHKEEQAFVPHPEDPDTVDIPRDLPAQKVQLKVQETLFGTVSLEAGSLIVTKPAGDYVLREGVEGQFLLATQQEGAPMIILGRYGPDTYSERALAAAIKAHKRT